MLTSVDAQLPASLQQEHATFLGYGALLSESSARLTFPHLTNFRLVQVPGWRRLFGHPHLFLIRSGVVDPSLTNHICALSAEPAKGGRGFVAAAFDVTLDIEQRKRFVEREGEYSIISVPFVELSDGIESGMGVLCASGTDATLAQCTGGIDYTPSNYAVETVWHAGVDCGWLPADIYLRHVLLAAESQPDCRAIESLLDDTVLADRVTSLRTYLDVQHTLVMAARPPEELKSRFSG